MYVKLIKRKLSITVMETKDRQIKNELVTNKSVGVFMLRDEFPNIVDFLTQKSIVPKDIMNVMIFTQFYETVNDDGVTKISITCMRLQNFSLSLPRKN